jgi:hypothetical protein
MIFNSITSFFRKKTYLIPLILYLIICFIYFYTLLLINKNILRPTNSNYFIYLLDAFAHRRFYIVTSDHYDLSLFQNKWYMYWGPAPALLIFPFYLLFHLQASNILYTAIGATMNVALLYFVIQEFKKFFTLSLSLTAEGFLLLSFSLASPNFFLSVFGQIWATSQIFATIYLLLCYLFYFQFLNQGKDYQLILSVVFFNLACLSRYSLVFNGVLFIYLVSYYKILRRALPAKFIWYLALPTLASISLQALYNYLRFHNVLEMGIRFQIGSSRYNAIVKSNAILSFHYVLHNIYYYFLNVMHFDLEGNSVFLFYPALLLLPVLFCKRKYVDRQRLAFLIIGGITIGLNVSFLMLYFATGWAQLGNRYFFDVIPLIFLLIVFSLEYIPFTIQILLLLWGIGINFCGILVFH